MRTIILRSKLTSMLAIAAAMLAAPALADTASVVKPEIKPTDKAKPVVFFNHPTVEVKEGTLNGKPILFVVMEGRFTPPEHKVRDWSLISDEKIIRMDQKGNSQFDDASGTFHFNLVLAGKVTKVEFTAVSPTGEVVRDQAGVIFDRYYEILARRGQTEKSLKDGPYLTVGLGVSMLDYKDDTRSGISQTTLIGKIALDQPIGRATPWSLGVNFFSTFAELSKSTSSSTQMFGANGRIGYRVLASGRWTIRVYLGLYYTTTYGGSDDIGYTNLMGPQIYPTFAYRQGNGAITSIYLKFSPVSNGGFKLYSTDNKEFATGVSYFFAPIQNGWLRGDSWGLTADFAWLSLKSAALGTSSFNSMSFGTALRF